MKKQTIIWTALPKGITQDGARLQLSVFVSPRLQTNEGGGNPTLQQFPDFLHWPDKMATATFQVKFDGGPTVAATRVAPASDPPPAELWKAIFHEQTRLKTYVFPDCTGRAINSFPVQNLQEDVRAVYETVAVVSPDRPPDFGPTQPGLGPTSDLLKNLVLPKTQQQDLTSGISRHMQSLQFKALYTEPPASTPRMALMGGTARPAASAFVARTNALRTTVTPSALAFHQLALFHEPVERKVGKLSPNLMAIKPPTPDFHEILTHLGQYPEVMRRLSLVIELEVPLQAGMTAATAVRVVPSWTPDLPTANVTPRTRCAVSSNSFVARPRQTPAEGSDIEGGMLRLNDPGLFEIGQMDVDAAALRTIDYANKVTRWVAMVAVAAQAGTPVPAPPAAETTPPPLRTAGIWVARVNRAIQLATQVLPTATARNEVVKTLESRFAATPASRAAGPVAPVATSATEDAQMELWAEDLVRGWRIDVWDDKTSQWHSLCRRIGTYHFANAAKGVDRMIAGVEDEGWISSGARGAADGSKSMSLHEIFVRWEGWSLSAPRPDKPLAEPGVAPGDTTEYGLDTEFVAKPGSLPRLRFGRQYRLRARLVDLAGNGIPWSSTESGSASEPLVFTRHEPVNAPVIVARKDLSNAKGETVDHIVLRSMNQAGPAAPGGAIGAFLPTDASQAQAKDAARTTEVSARHIAPPKTSELMSEMHGMFDTDAGMKGDLQTFQMLLDHDKPLAKFYDVDRMPMPYLPDPLATLALVRIKFPLSADPAKEYVLQVPFTGTWPDIEPFRLDVYEPAGAGAVPEFDAASRTLRLPLPKAETAEISVSCSLPAQAVGNMAVWRMSVDSLTIPKLAKLQAAPLDKQRLRFQLADPRQLSAAAPRAGLDANLTRQLVDLGRIATEGRNVLLTPARPITVLHAVQQPLGVPQIQYLTVARDFGDTYASFYGRIALDGKSTVKVDVHAEWTDPVDDLAWPQWQGVTGSSHVWEIGVETGDKFALIAQPVAKLLEISPALFGAAAGTPRPTPTVVQPPAAAVQPLPGRPPTRLQPTQPVQPIQPTAPTSQKVPIGAATPMVLRTGTAAKVSAASLAARPEARTGLTRNLSNQALRKDVARSRLFDPGLLQVLPAGIPRRHEFGDTKYRKVRYTAITTTRHKSCFNLSEADIRSGKTPITRVSQQVTVEVPSSARPAAPKLMYVIPTFGWERQALPNGQMSRRTSGGMRVYLERPWFSSGEGEQLGVVIPWPRAAGVDVMHKDTYGWMPVLKSLVTQMGADPTWRTTATPAWPGPEAFTHKLAWEGDLTLDELTQGPDSLMRMRRDLRVAVVGHEVLYDPQRQLWYSDIELDPGQSYFPFVRLALARYQPKSVQHDAMDVKLSRVVLADFVQLLPERIATITYLDKRTIAISVTGVSYIGSARVSGSSRMEVSLETAGANLTGDLRWRPVAGDPIQLSAQRPADGSRRWTWTGRMTLPADRGTQAFRLALKEYEVYEIDRPAGTAVAVVAVPAQPTTPRLVYAETFEF
jgi:hypothetical protein